MTLTSVMRMRHLASTVLRRPRNLQPLIHIDSPLQTHCIKSHLLQPITVQVRFARVKTQHVREALTKKYNVNTDIVSATGNIRVIDENGVNLGVMSLDKGLEVAKEREFDLVQISPNEEPVCRLMDFDKTMEEKARSRVESLKQQAMVKKKDKEIRLGTSISEKDLETKLKQAKEFLSEQRTVTLNIIYRKSKALKVADRKARGEEIAGVLAEDLAETATLIGKKDTLGFLSLIYKPLPESTKRKKQKEKEKQMGRDSKKTTEQET